MAIEYILCIKPSIRMLLIVCYILTAETVASEANKSITGFSNVQKFEPDFQPSDNPCITSSAASMTDSQSVTEEGIDRPQSECDQLPFECSSDAEESDTVGENLPRCRQTKVKNSLVSAAVTDREW